MASVRRRGAALEAAILDAAWEELNAAGYANLTMEGVAARARTGKAVLYRRWPTRAQLVLAAMRRQVVPLSEDVPDTGGLRTDVLALLRRAAGRYHDFGPELIRDLFFEFPRDEMEIEVFQVVPRAMTGILKRAAERGEVRLDAITPRMARLPLDLVRHELILTLAPIPESVLAEIVDDIFLPLLERP